MVSILLILLMAGVSTQPTLALHFCGGSLHAVSLRAVDAEKSCCKKAGKHAPKGTSFSKAAGRCCSDYTIEVTTDTFQQQQEITTDVYSSVSLLPYLVSDSLPYPNSYFPLQRIYPPGSLALQNADLLTRYCKLNC
ncbi:MAG: hypothetical protein LBV39_01485 [Bacteroidales bacterium]|nr:hypothetical protein [Bacteroidales bacterium]